MRHNGLCSEFTLGEYHFHPDTQTLTEAGRLKVADILRRQPENFGQIFLTRGGNQQHSAMRLDSVQQTVAQFIPMKLTPMQV